MRRHLKNTRFWLTSTLLAVSFFSVSVAAQTLNTGTSLNEPARWTQEDVTRQHKISTATKEAVAAQQQSIDECKKLATTMQAECIANARVAYRQDMEAIRIKFNQ